MTKERAALPGKVVAEQEPFFDRHSVVEGLAVSFPTLLSVRASVPGLCLVPAIPDHPRPEVIMKL
jgi:hypothetical protein